MNDTGNTREWQREYPRVMKWDDVPEERRRHKDEVGPLRANNLDNRQCDMAIDTGSVLGKRWGLYEKCGVPSMVGERFCCHHGGPKKTTLAETLNEFSFKLFCSCGRRMNGVIKEEDCDKLHCTCGLVWRVNKPYRKE